MKTLYFLLLLPTLALANPKVKPGVLPPLRPFVGADLVWSMRGPAVLGPDSGSAIEAALTQPPELTRDCQLGDLSVRDDRVDIQLTCGAAKHTVVARLRPGTSPLGIEAIAGASEALAQAQTELQRRLDAGGARSPLQHPSVRDVAGMPQRTSALEYWQQATRALLAADLSAAITATDLAIAQGPATLNAANRVDAAIVATALGRFARVQAWLGEVKKAAPEDADAMAVRTLLGKRKDVLALAQKCVAPEGRPACDIEPLIRALIAQQAWREAGQLLEVRINHRDPAADDVRLALGMALLTEDKPAALKWSLLLTKLRPDDAGGWQSAARALEAKDDVAEALQLLLRAPEAVAKQTETLEQVVQLLDTLEDPLSPQALDATARRQMEAQVASSTTTAAQLARAVLEGWRGDPRTAQHLAALPGAETEPVLLALRALALLGTPAQAQAELLVAKALQLGPNQPQAAEAQWQWTIVQDKPDDQALAAYERAVQAATNGRAVYRVRRAHVAADLRTWGLVPPPRWPAWPVGRP